MPSSALFEAIDWGDVADEEPTNDGILPHLGGIEEGSDAIAVIFQKAGIGE
jgi:hypothetical protein